MLVRHSKLFVWKAVFKAQWRAKKSHFRPSVEKWHENVDKKDDNKKSNDLGNEHWIHVV